MNKTDSRQRFLVCCGQSPGLNKRPGEDECVGQFPTLVEIRLAGSAKISSILWKYWCRPTLTFNFSSQGVSIEFHEYIENIELNHYVERKR